LRYFGIDGIVPEVVLILVSTQMQRCIAAISSQRNCPSARSRALRDNTQHLGQDFIVGLENILPYVIVLENAGDAMDCSLPQPPQEGVKHDPPMLMRTGQFANQGHTGANNGG
jgi:hypothetical protein